jgi:hypothetical protein
MLAGGLLLVWQRFILVPGTITDIAGKMVKILDFRDHFLSQACWGVFQYFAELLAN